jgi:hypothetical protein
MNRPFPRRNCCPGSSSPAGCAAPARRDHPAGSCPCRARCGSRWVGSGPSRSRRSSPSASGSGAHLLPRSGCSPRRSHSAPRSSGACRGCRKAGQGNQRARCRACLYPAALPGRRPASSPGCTTGLFLRTGPGRISRQARMLSRGPGWRQLQIAGQVSFSWQFLW